jgi:hypothetical protein
MQQVRQDQDRILNRSATDLLRTENAENELTTDYE